jgi:hypothetical protein
MLCFAYPNRPRRSRDPHFRRGFQHGVWMKNYPPELYFLLDLLKE